MSTARWQSGTLYQPGAMVRPVSAPEVLDQNLDNPDFEDGDTGWTLGTGWEIDEGTAVAGTWRAHWSGIGHEAIENDAKIATTPGEQCAASAYVYADDSYRDAGIQIYLRYYSASDAHIGQSDGLFLQGKDCVRAWRKINVSGIAPANAAYFRVRIDTNNFRDVTWLVDGVRLESVHQAPDPGLVFTAVQSAAGFSGSAEPAWPDTVGQQVVDHQVTWEAIEGGRVTWRAKPILVSGSTEPTWPDDGVVSDNTIAWERDPRRVTDSRAPNSPVVALAASKIFATDGDIIPFCATVNPLDWTTRDDSGYLPFGLQTYGAQPASALGLYRGNLVVFNAAGFQMWQVDEDPANMALLDAAPVGCTFPRSLQPVMNDLAFLTNKGIRSIGIAGASTNLQVGDFGKAIDPLVLEAIKAIENPPDPEHAFELGTADVGAFGVVRYGFDDVRGGSLSPLTLLGVTVSAIHYTPSTNRWLVALRDELEQSFFTQVEFEGFGTFESKDATFTSVAGMSTWTWTGSGTGWGQFQLRDVAFTGGPSADVREPIGLYVPGMDQYWLIFGDEAFVLTINGNDKSSMSWSRYTFPAAIDDWTLLDGELYLRAGDLVWRVDDEALYDDQDEELGAGGADIDIEGVVSWPYLDLGAIGRTKQMVGFDLVIQGECAVSFGYDQKDEALATDPYTVDGDTLTGDVIPMPLAAPSVQMRLTFSGGQDWEWSASVIYLNDFRMGS